MWQTLNDLRFPCRFKTVMIYKLSGCLPPAGQWSYCKCHWLTWLKRLKLGKKAQNSSIKVCSFKKKSSDKLWIVRTKNLSIFNSDSIWINTSWDLFSLDTNPLIKHRLSYDQHNSKCKTFNNKCTNHTHKTKPQRTCKSMWETSVKIHNDMRRRNTCSLKNTVCYRLCDCNLDIRIWP